MKINKTDEELEQLLNEPAPDDAKIKKLMTIPLQEILQESITKYGIGFIYIEKGSYSPMRVR